MGYVALVTGWLAAVAIALSGAVPLGYRLRTGKRGALRSLPIRSHVILGVSTAALAFGHTLMAVPVLGSPRAIAGGMVALVPAGAAFCLLIAHAGIGLSLTNERLKERAKKRRTHVFTASAIAITVAIHVVVLLRA